MNLEHMKAVFADEGFVKSLFELETVAQVQGVLQEKGVELTEEEILAVRTLLAKVESGEISREQLESGELSETALEQVAGGMSTVTLVTLVISYAVAAAGSTAGGIGLYNYFTDRRGW